MDGEDSFSLLHSLPPVPFVAAAIGPIHFAVALPGVVLVVALVDVACFPGVDAVALFPVSLVVSLVLVAVSLVLLLPDAVSLSISIFEHSFVETALCPVVFTETIGFPHKETALVEITRNELLGALTML